jgi:hypothetical protein
MFGKNNCFVSKAKVSACMHFLVNLIHLNILLVLDNILLGLDNLIGLDIIYTIYKILLRLDNLNYICRGTSIFMDSAIK